MEFKMSNQDNAIRESGQHKTVVMLASQLQGILTPPVRARKLKKTIGIFEPPPFEKLNTDVLNANMDDTAEMNETNSYASSLQHRRNHISCIPIMKLSTARSCLISSDGTESTNESSFTQLESNAQEENVTWHVPIAQELCFDPSISNNVHENIDEDMGESCSELFSEYPTKLPTVVFTTQCGNIAEDIAGKDSKQGVLRSILSMPDLEPEQSEFTITDDRKHLPTLFNDQVSESDLDRFNLFSLSQTKSKTSEIANPQGCTADEFEPNPSIQEIILPHTMISHIVSETGSEKGDGELKYEQSVTKKFSPMVDLRLEVTKFSRTPTDAFIVSNSSTANAYRQIPQEISSDRFPKERPSQADFSSNRHETSHAIHMSNPQNNRLAANSENWTAQNIYHKNNREVFDERENREVNFMRSSSLAELSQADFTVVSRRASEPSHIMDAGNKEWADSQHSTIAERNLASPNPDEYYSVVLLPAMKNPKQTISCKITEGLNMCFPSGGRGFGESQSEPVAILKSSSMADSSRSNSAVSLLKVSHPTHILNPAKRRSTSSQNSIAGAKDPASPIQEIIYYRDIFPPKTIPTQTTPQTSEVPDTYHENIGFNDLGSKQITTPKSSPLTVPSETNSGVIAQRIYQYTQTPISEDNTWVRTYATEESGSAPPIREHPFLRFSLPSEPPTLAEAKSHQTIETLNMYEKGRKKFDKRGFEHIANSKLSPIADSPKSQSFVMPHGISEPAYILNMSQNNRLFTGENESGPSVQDHHHSLGILQSETIPRNQTPEVLSVYEQKGDERSEGSRQDVTSSSYSMAKLSHLENPIFPGNISQPTHYFHCENRISNISQNPSVGGREPASPTREHNYSSASLPSEMIPTQIVPLQGANSPHVYYRNENRFEQSESNQIGNSRSFSMLDLSKYSVTLIPQKMPHLVSIQNSNNNRSATSRNCNIGESGPAHTLGEHNYSILLTPNEMMSTETSPHQTTNCIFRETEIENSHKWKYYQIVTPSSTLDCSTAITSSHFSNSPQGRVTHLRDCASERETPFSRGNPNGENLLLPKLIPIRKSSSQNYNTAPWSAPRTDFLQENEESLRVQVPNYHNYSNLNQNQFSAPKPNPLARSPVKRSRKSTLGMPPSQIYPSPRPNSSWFSMNTKGAQPNRESLPSYRYHPYPIQQGYRPPPSLPDATLQSSHAISNREIVPNPYYLNNSQNLNNHINKLGSAVSYAPNMVPPSTCRDQTSAPKNTSVDRRYPEFDQRHIPHQASTYPLFSNNTYYDAFGSTNSTRGPKKPRKIRSKTSRVPKKTTRGVNPPNYDNKEELNKHQVPRTQSQHNSNAVGPNTPLVLKTYYFFTNQNKKFRPTSEQLENELRSKETNSTNLRVITDENTKYLAILEGSASTFETVQKLGVISTNFQFIDRVVQSFFANGAAELIGGNPLSSFEIKEVNEIPSNATCQVAANETGSIPGTSHMSHLEEESIASGGTSEHKASVSPDHSISQEENQPTMKLITMTMKQSDDKLQLILAAYQDPSEGLVRSQKGSAMDILKKELSSNESVTLLDVLRIYFMGEESRDELVDIISKLLNTEK